MAWPTDEQLARFGAVRCVEADCTTWLNPAERPQGRCAAHQRQARRSRQARPVDGRGGRRPVKARER